MPSRLMSSLVALGCVIAPFQGGQARMIQQQLLWLPTSGLVVQLPHEAGLTVESGTLTLHDGELGFRDTLRLETPAGSTRTLHVMVLLEGQSCASYLEPHRPRVGRLTVHEQALELFQDGSGLWLCQQGQHRGLVVELAEDYATSVLNPSELRALLKDDFLVRAILTAYHAQHFAVLGSINAGLAMAEGQTLLPGSERALPAEIGDGFRWQVLSDGAGPLHLISELPAFAPAEAWLAVEAGSTCGELGRYLSDYEQVDVSNWQAKQRVSASGVEHVYCRHEGSRTFWVKTLTASAVAEPSVYVALLDTFYAHARESWPPASSREASIHDVGASVVNGSARQGLNFIFAELGLTGGLSIHRTGGRDATLYPELRTQGPGLRGSWLSVHHGFMWGFSGAIGLDFESRHATGAARWGSMASRLSAELGYLVGDTWFVGLSAGFGLMAGPLTLNRSLPLSAYLGYAPPQEADFGVLMKVTPFQLFASNGRQALSPLLIDVMFTTEMQSFGFEFQYLGAPQGNESGMGLGGWALTLQYGVAGFMR